MDSQRAARLGKVFDASLRGNRPVATTKDAQLFLEAVRECPSPSTCIEKMIASPSGLQAMRHSVRASDSLPFTCAHVFPTISYLAHPDVKAISEGQLLQQVLVAIVDPPTAWTSMLRLYVDNGFLEDQASAETFAWLCLETVTSTRHELITLSDGLADALEKRPLVDHKFIKVRELGYQVRKMMEIRASLQSPTGLVSNTDMETPGGRHDNDFADFRKIQVYPSTDEFSSTLRPFYRRAHEVASSDKSQRPRVHLDNQFRLLREDMLGELRDDVRDATGKKKKSRRPAQILGKLRLSGMNTGDEKRGQPCTLLVAVGSGLEVLRAKNTNQRKTHLKDNTNLLRHQAFGALCCEAEVVGFAFIHRDVDLLAGDPPVVGLQFRTSEVLTKAMVAFQVPDSLRFVLVDTPVFAYEPVLERLKEITEIPLEKQILDLFDGSEPDRDDGFVPAKHLQEFLRRRKESCRDELPLRIGGAEYKLDAAQADALSYALGSPLSLIQGPPGTGKSFIGALAAKKLLDGTSTRLLVLSYTNHALDQFLEDLLKIGIKQESMTRLGSKFSAATASLSFEDQFRKSETPRSKESFSRSFLLKQDLKEIRHNVEDAFNKFTGNVSWMDILDHLEFSDNPHAQLFWRAFQVPTQDDGFTMTGKRGSPIKPDYLLDRWKQGKGPGPLGRHIAADCAPIWAIPGNQRAAHLDSWVKALREEQIETLRALIDRSNETQVQIDGIFKESRCLFMKTKRVIGCTTTAAAKYASLIKAARPDCVLVEEAGEILEAHIITALGSATRQLVLIGDHKQLRPKCNNYALSVEKGDGYDLNRSLFERLILQGHRHATLRKQYRMVPEISHLIRSMTYGDLLDGPKVFERPSIRGIRGRVAFVNHNEPEVDASEIQDSRDASYKASKRNRFEADMILKLVRYLGQQGYNTSNIVVLTPYLGQLRLLRDMLSKETDPLLSDLDSFELIRAGLLTAAAGKVDKGQIRLSTIDNYQGEESDIVIASLTRSNARGDIGFMKAPERLNVLVSRARNCLIMFGNMDTFMASSQGKDTWVPFFKLLKDEECLQDGLWVHCERHPERTAMLSTPRDFDFKCPDGGCSEACGAKLKCGIHDCQRQCHRLTDHSKIPCNQLIDKTCDKKQHSYKANCTEKHVGCPKCHQEEEDIRRRAKRDLEMDKARLARQAAYRQELEEIQDEISHEKRLIKEHGEVDEQTRTLEQQRADLAALKETRARQAAMEKAEQEQRDKVEETLSSGADSHKKKYDGDDVEPGSAREEWEYLKRVELARSEAMDRLMGMIGLEDVKRAFLEIKSTVDTATRQGVSTKSERFGCSLLGNPGTGKTTVARLYARFLTSVGVIAGSCFEETTGSKLASMGVPGCQKLLDQVLEKGGGVIFIDEAYQLSSGNTPGGRAILDFLLAEVENLNSQICFVLAGYTRQMESFFAHNPGLPSRFPRQMKFADYNDQELLQILERCVNAKYSNRMKAEDGLRGLYCRIVAQRLGHGRGKDGFGNARAVENMLSRIYHRQSGRLRRQRRQGRNPDDLLLTKEDLIGPEPSNALLKSQAWGELQKLIGLGSVKTAVQSLVDSIHTNYQRELNEEPIIEYSLNRVFLGNPGTGKTTVAKIYGQILVDLGLLSNGEVIVKNPSDFVGSALGQSEQQTKGILASSMGKVLVIDEAYGLYGGGASQGGGSSDPYKTAVVDTIVAEVQSTPGDDRCVLLLGYKDQMEEMFQNVNPGLSRRFPLASAFVFEDFTQSELAAILDMKLKKQGFRATDTAKTVALEMLDRARNRPNFGNAGEVDILLNDAKSRHQTRVTAGETQRVSMLEARDFDVDFDRLDHSETSVADLFRGTVGCERIIATLEGYQETARTMKALGMDPKEAIPFNFLFRGPPGTGKSTTARRMGKVFYDAGFLAQAEVIECSASDIIGQYVGQTGPKVRHKLDEALGRVLLIDEAYRLAEGHFAKEALDEIVDAVTKERYHKRLIIVLAGYEDDTSRLLGVNPGLTSRFSECIDFRGLDPGECFTLLVSKLLGQKNKVEQQGKGTMDVASLEMPSTEFHSRALKVFSTLSTQPSWGSARDVETLAKGVFRRAIKSVRANRGAAITVSEMMVMDEIENMVKERGVQAKQVSTSVPEVVKSLTLGQQKPPEAQLHCTKVATSQFQQQEQHAATPDNSDSEAPSPEEANRCRKTAVRDVGVGDEVWDQLQKDAEAEERREEEYQAKLKAKRDAVDDALREQIVKELVQEEERRKEEAEMKKRLEVTGRCPVGYPWIRQEGGWRCAGGSHFVCDGDF